MPYHIWTSNTNKLFKDGWADPTMCESFTWVWIDSTCRSSENFNLKNYNSYYLQYFIHFRTWISRKREQEQSLLSIIQQRLKQTNCKARFAMIFQGVANIGILTGPEQYMTIHRIAGCSTLSMQVFSSPTITSFKSFKFQQRYSTKRSHADLDNLLQKRFY